MSMSSYMSVYLLHNVSYEQFEKYRKHFIYKSPYRYSSSEYLSKDKIMRIAFIDHGGMGDFDYIKRLKHKVTRPEDHNITGQIIWKEI